MRLAVVFVAALLLHADTVLDIPSHGIAIGPGGSIIAVMIAMTPGLPVTANAAQSRLNGATDVYLVKWTR